MASKQQITRIAELAETDGADMADADIRYGNSLTRYELADEARIAAERANELRYADEPNRFNREDLSGLPFLQFERHYAAAWKRGYLARKEGKR